MKNMPIIPETGDGGEAGRLRKRSNFRSGIAIQAHGASRPQAED
jgi:hypothetical protein